MKKAFSIPLIEWTIWSRMFIGKDEEIPDLKHAFITINDIDSKSLKKGIACLMNMAFSIPLIEWTICSWMFLGKDDEKVGS